jgi:hypothetical protein
MRGTIYPQKLALTSPTSGGRSVGIVRSQTQATEFLKYASDHRVAEQANQESTVKTSGKYACNYLPPAFTLIYCLTYFSFLKTEATASVV